MKEKKLTIEERYQHLEHRDQILLRPDTYIGTTISEDRNIFVVDDINNLENIKMVNKIVKFNPGFLKIVDEILTNASDHFLRTGKVKYIKVNVENDFISIENDGQGIPVEIHKKEKKYVAELIFGNLLTSENYNDNVERTWGGRNGVGAKATNIFSKRFIVETADGKKIFHQEFSENMSKKTKPKIKASKKNYTKITFYPDFGRFEMMDIDDETKSVIIRRCIDIAVYCQGIKVYYNNFQIPVKNFKDYMKMFVGEDSELFTEKLDDKWEIGISKSLDNGFYQVSMVNGISTYKGGTHVNYITNQIAKNTQEILSKKYKKLNIKPNDIKNNIFLFVNTKIINPKFDEQAKETLASKINGGPELSEKLIKQFSNSQIIEDVIRYLNIREQVDTKKEIGKHRIKISKLDDAKKAGTYESDKCFLMLCEGDCLQEDTEINIIRDGNNIKVKMKDLKLNDAVITHNNNIGLINNISKKIEKIVKIKLKNNQILLCSENHKWYVYDKKLNKFIFIKTKDLDIKKHRMIINKNTFYNNFFKIKDIFDYDNKKYEKIIFLNNGEEILSTNNHLFSIFNIIDYKFEMISCINLNKDIHYIVSYEKI
jgi:DNA topoisomerase-2